MTTSAINVIHRFEHAQPVATSSEGNANSPDQQAGITANDFLTLLVTEMKNQDPTAQTDPNEYINQLVQVNSLQQLIEINQNLASAVGSSGEGPGASPTGKAVSAHPAAGGAVAAAPSPASESLTSETVPWYSSSGSNHGVAVTPGNLGVPVYADAGRHVAHALSGSR